MPSSLSQMLANLDSEAGQTQLEFRSGLSTLGSIFSEPGHFFVSSDSTSGAHLRHLTTSIGNFLNWTETKNGLRIDIELQ